MSDSISIKTLAISVVVSIVSALVAYMAGIERARSVETRVLALRSEVALLQDSLARTERRLVDGELREQGLLRNLEDIALRLEAAATKAMAQVPPDDGDPAPDGGASSAARSTPEAPDSPRQQPSGAQANAPMNLLPPAMALPTVQASPSSPPSDVAPPMARSEAKTSASP